ncbi:MAG TPA: serine hydrolase [Candidatus Marinimicrobia bacterium]|nr:serine hydrolase [Candidatus Neomarinimicrobiota bacterium]
MRKIIYFQYKRLSLVFFLLLFALTGCHSSGSKAARFDEYLQSCFENDQFNGCVLVAEKGKVIYHKAFGIANFDPLIPPHLDSQFRLASVSKQFTAMAIMLLKEHGKLDYDDDLQKYLPELSYPGITIRRLLTHTSGIPKYEDLCEQYWDVEHENFLEKKYATNDDIIAMLVEYHPDALFKPGDKYVYSNTGYVLLASIVSRVSGEPFEVFMKKNIFDPLEMSHTLVFSAIREDPMENRVYGYRLALNGSDYLPNDFHYMSGIAGDGAIYSTTGDLFKWDRALYTEKLVSKSSLEEAFTPVILNDGSTHNYGFGWSIDTSLTGKKSVSHGGGWIAARTWIMREIEEDNTAIILTNNTTRYMSAIQKGIVSILHDKSCSLPKINISQFIGKTLVTQGVDAAVTQYHDLRNTKPALYNFDKWELNTLGHELLRLEKMTEAIEIFKLNIDSYPEFPRAYSSLGEAYRLNGNPEQAIEAFEKTLEIDPGNWYAIEKLKQLAEK